MVLCYQGEGGYDQFTVNGISSCQFPFLPFGSQIWTAEPRTFLKTDQSSEPRDCNYEERQVHLGNRKYYYTRSGILDSDWSIRVLSSQTFGMMTAVLYTVLFSCLVYHFRVYFHLIGDVL